MEPLCYVAEESVWCVAKLSVKCVQWGSDQPDPTGIRTHGPKTDTTLQCVRAGNGKLAGRVNRCLRCGVSLCRRFCLQSQPGEGNGPTQRPVSSASGLLSWCQAGAEWSFSRQSSFGWLLLSPSMRVHDRLVIVAVVKSDAADQKLRWNNHCGRMQAGALVWPCSPWIHSVVPVMD